jgi:hypothetical protein
MSTRAAKQEFLSKDPAKALVEVKEKLYARLENADQATIAFANRGNETDECISFFKSCEADWLRNLLDLIERS